MDSKEFRKRGREMVDYIADYRDSISQRRVIPNVQPGYLRNLIPYDPPAKGEKWEKIMEDVDICIMPGMTHWLHPRFHAYFPTGASYASILADMLTDGIACIGFSWASSPVCAELETIMLDWMGKMIGLPEGFLRYTEGSKGGGGLEGSASDCALVTLLAARHNAILSLKRRNPTAEKEILLSSLIAYCSKEAHSCFEKAAMIAFIKLRLLDVDEFCQLRGNTLQEAMAKDISDGFHPFYVAATLGTTSCSSCDVLHEIGPVCEKYGVWLHIDAAYVGSAMICPEFRPILKGIDYAMSFSLNPSKWMLMHFDCSCLWVKDRFKFTNALAIDPLYLQHNFSDKTMDYRHWGIPLSRRFRALKLWFVIRNYGIERLQSYIRNHIHLAKLFESFVRSDDLFDVVNEVRFGLVCFRMKSSNGLNEKLLWSINASGKLHMTGSLLNEKFILRFCVCYEHATDEDIIHAWDVISYFARELLQTKKGMESLNYGTQMF